MDTGVAPAPRSAVLVETGRSSAPRVRETGLGRAPPWRRAPQEGSDDMTAIRLAAAVLAAVLIQAAAAAAQ